MDGNLCSRSVAGLIYSRLASRLRGRPPWRLRRRTIRLRPRQRCTEPFHPGEPGFRYPPPSRGLIVGHTRHWPRSTIPAAVLCPGSPRPFQRRFRHCGPSASHAAAFDPRSRRSDITEGILSYFAVAERGPPLSFPPFRPTITTSSTPSPSRATGRSSSPRPPNQDQLTSSDDDHPCRMRRPAGLP